MTKPIPKPKPIKRIGADPDESLSHSLKTRSLNDYMIEIVEDRLSTALMQLDEELSDKFPNEDSSNEITYVLNDLSAAAAIFNEESLERFLFIQESFYQKQRDKKNKKLN